MNTRVDIHRPSAIIPADYQFVACDYWGPSDVGLEFLGDRMAFRAHMERTGGTFAHHDHGGSCHICGAGAFYIAKFYHPKTNTYIVTGMNCASKLDMGDPAYFAAFRKRIQAGIACMAGKNKAQMILAEKELSAAWDIYNASERTNFKWEESTISDIVGKLVRYGEISEKQTAFLSTLLVKIEERAQVEAQRAAEHAAADPLPPTGDRIEITGTVLAIREPNEDDMYPVTKLLVRADAGWKVWGSRPSALDGVERGNRVTFFAKVTPSNNDEKFGFYSRPTKARIID